MSTFQLGPGPNVCPTLFSENRQRVVSAFIDVKPEENSFIVLEGGHDVNRYNTDMQEVAFRQESYFYWATGVTEPEFFAVINVKTGCTVLFPPKLEKDSAVWHGKIHSEAFFKDKYKVDEVIFNVPDAISTWLTSHSARKLYLLRAFNTDSSLILEPAEFSNKSKFNVDVETLFFILAELRVFKTDKEFELLRYASKIASQAHMKLMTTIKPGTHYQYQMESLFQHESYFTGACRHVAYTCISASGADGAALHYGHAGAPNDHLIKDGDMCLFDMGPEYACYASDVTCSFPANGKFTDKQKIIYTAVWEARCAVFEQAKPGVRWTDMHKLAEKVILQHLINAGILKGNVDEMLEKRVGAVFLPCGLGHFMGLDVHDVGGYLGDATPRSKLPGLKCLRTTRTLQERMVITIEPGIYFIDPVLDEALTNPEIKDYFNNEVLKGYRGFGGVRIEDDVIIWAKGNECMNKVPRTIPEIEAFMANHI